MNAFTSVRPRGVDAPAKAPRKTNHSKAPTEGRVPSPYVYDRAGRRTVSLERKTTGGIVIESREQSAASLAKFQRIKGGGK